MFFPHTVLGASHFFHVFLQPEQYQHFVLGWSQTLWNNRENKILGTHLAAFFLHGCVQQKIHYFYTYILCSTFLYIAFFYTFYITNVFFAPSQSLCTFILVLTYSYTHWFTPIPLQSTLYIVVSWCQLAAYCIVNVSFFRQSRICQSHLIRVGLALACKTNSPELALLHHEHRK